MTPAELIDSKRRAENTVRDLLPPGAVLYGLELGHDRTLPQLRLFVVTGQDARIVEVTATAARLCGLHWNDKTGRIDRLNVSGSALQHVAGMLENRLGYKPPTHRL
jgi:hypothetical protein